MMHRVVSFLAGRTSSGLKSVGTARVTSQLTRLTSSERGRGAPRCASCIAFISARAPPRPGVLPARSSFVSVSFSVSEAASTRLAAGVTLLACVEARPARRAKARERPHRTTSRG